MNTLGYHVSPKTPCSVMSHDSWFIKIQNMVFPSMCLSMHGAYVYVSPFISYACWCCLPIHLCTLYCRYIKLSAIYNCFVPCLLGKHTFFLPKNNKNVPELSIYFWEPESALDSDLPVSAWDKPTLFTHIWSDTIKHFEVEKHNIICIQAYRWAAL